jgi:chemotaxis protein methyltransferase CheR
MTTILASSDTGHNNGLLSITDAEFQRIRRIVHERFGIFLADSKRSLVQGRLNKEVRSMGFSSFTEYADAMEKSINPERLLSLADYISTNHSFFFREAEHFQYLLSAVLPSLLKQGVGMGEIRIWSAGSSEGQEPYTIAMVLRESQGPSIFRLGPPVLGTDISVSSLRRAAEGIYPITTLRSVPPRYRSYFRTLDDGRVQVSDDVRAGVLFRRLNLHQSRYPFTGRFHVIFCRNVMIYFDVETKRSLASRLREYLNEGGYLFVGHSESLGREISGFEYVRPTVYRRCR